jgi:DNA-binding MarR family transcriptional regulator
VNADAQKADHPVARTWAKGKNGTDLIPSDIHLLVGLLKMCSLVNRPMDMGVASHHGLSLNELRVMMCLSGEGVLAGHEISDLMSIPPMNVSRALVQLLEKGWVEPVVDESNRRRKPVRISGAGWEAYRAMTPDIRAVADQLLDPLGPDDRAAMGKAMTLLIGQMENFGNS